MDVTKYLTSARAFVCIASAHRHFHNYGRELMVISCGTCVFIGSIVPGGMCDPGRVILFITW